jgi:ribose transport system permease protein
LFAYRETWVALALAAFFALGSVLRPDFFPTSSNLGNILREMSQLGIIAIGVSFVIVNGDLDLSVGSVFGFASLTVAQLVYFSNWSPWPAALVALGVGVVFGLVNGTLVTRLRLPAFIVTLAMMFIARGLTLAVSASQRFSLTSNDLGFYALGQPGVLGINNQVFVLILVLGVLGTVMWRTPFGYRVYASGGNRNAATVSGIDTNRVRMQSFVISSFCAALAGVLSIAFTPSFSPDAGQGLELDAVAAAVVGGISLFGGRGSALGAVLGVGFLITIRKILIVGITLGGGGLWRLPQTATPAFIGAFILLAVIIDVWVREEQLLARWIARLQGRFMPARPTGTASETLGTKGRAMESLPPPGFRGLLVRVFGSREAGGVAIFVLVFVVGTILRTDFFPSAANVSIAIQEQVFQIALIALGMTLVIVNGDIDLSVGSTLSLSGAVFAVTMLQGASPWVAAIPAILAGLTVGAVNGFLSTRGKLPPFIVTLGMLQLAKGLASTIAAGPGRPLTDFAPSSFFTIFGAQNQLVLGAILLVIFAVMLWRGLWGYQHYAVGGNRRAATFAGLNVNWVRARAFVITGGLAALAGVMNVSKNQSFVPTVGDFQELYVISAVIVGGTSLLGGRGSVLGSFIGALILGFITNILTIPVYLGGELTTLPQTWLQIIFGLVLLLAVIADLWIREERIVQVFWQRLTAGRRP